ncbi:hypothetical protein [Bacteroides acidifaciens]|uniref:hypothetical protein n=1 Tax=Bacteroides acidifaciens TaxID=85831 RepID=UPI002557E092|nr:hypothetical protein [Bacteroides acidifaciens]
MDLIDNEEKNNVIDSFNNIKFKFYSAFDMRILLAEIFFGVCLSIVPPIISNLNNNNLIEFYMGKGKEFFIVYTIAIALIFLAALIQIIRMNVINRGVYIEVKDNKKLLILNGLFYKKYIFNGKQYRIKNGAAFELKKFKRPSFEKLLSDFQKTKICKITQGKKTIYSTQLLKIKSDWFDIFIETGLTSLPSRYVRIKFKGDRLVKGILNGSQQQCAIYFNFTGKIQNIMDLKIPDKIYESLKTNRVS